jgi:uncharacterized damage-inducible protein DinB
MSDGIQSLKKSQMEALSQNFLQATEAVFRQHKDWAEKALAQLEDDAAFFRSLGPRSHSIAVTVKHVAGNLRSRWLNFLTTDGEKPDRNRDQEFIISDQDTRHSLMQGWEEAWAILFSELKALKADDLLRTVTVRKEPLSVVQAIQRSLAHTAYHTGQILYLCRLLKEGDWQWLTVQPGQSQKLNQEMAQRYSK